MKITSSSCWVTTGHVTGKEYFHHFMHLLNVIRDVTNFQQTWQCTLRKWSCDGSHGYSDLSNLIFLSQFVLAESQHLRERWEGLTAHLIVIFNQISEETCQLLYWWPGVVEITNLIRKMQLVGFNFISHRFHTYHWVNVCDRLFTTAACLKTNWWGELEKVETIYVATMLPIK